MQLNKKNLMIIGLSFGIMLFFIGMGTYLLLGPATETYLLPHQISSVIKLSGMAIVCISMIVGGFFIENLDKDVKSLLIIFGVVLLLLNIFILSYSSY